MNTKQGKWLGITLALGAALLLLNAALAIWNASQLSEGVAWVVSHDGALAELAPEQHDLLHQREQQTQRSLQVAAVTGTLSAILGLGILAVFAGVLRHHRLELAKSEQELASFPKLNPYPVIEADLQGRLHFVNPAAERLFPDLRQRGPEHPWLVDWESVASAFREGVTQSMTREVSVGDQWYQQAIYYVEASQRIRVYAMDVSVRKQGDEILKKAHAALEARVRERTRELETTLDALEAQRRRFNDVLDRLPAYVVLLTRDYHVPFANRFFRERFGESNGHRCYEYLFQRTEPCEVCETYTVLKTNAPHRWEWTGPDGRNYDIYDFPFTDADGSDLILEMGLDITERKAAEAELVKHRQHLEEMVQQRTAELQVANTQLQAVLESLRESQDDLNRAQAVARTGSWRLDLRRNELRWSEENHRMFGIPEGTPLKYETFLATIHPDDQPLVDRQWRASLRGEPYDVEHRIVVDGKVKWVRERAELDFDKQGTLLGGFGTTQDITDHKLAEQAVKDREEELAAIYENAPLIMMLVDDQRRVRKTNRLAEQLVGEVAASMIGQRGGEALRCIHALTAPDGCGSGPHCEQCKVRRTILETMETGRTQNQVEASLTLAGGDKPQDMTFLLSTTRLRVREELLVLATIQDITDRKRAEEALQLTAEELARSNKDLEQFAYVASHDLQEPLRMVTGFVQLLQQKYGGQLDADAHQFIDFAVDGAKRMQNLINDLLAYSRTGTRGRDPVPTDVATALAKALDNLRMSIEETAAEITHGELPTVPADSTQLVQLFQNLIGNALKFRGAAPPKIHVDACRAGDEWQLSVRDNGIGISPEFRERIFLIFQRLHTRKQYPGTGIGLAICKKIVDRHGGRIWVESQPGQGATFYFTLPG